jgi:hypothetical protein
VTLVPVVGGGAREVRAGLMPCVASPGERKEAYEERDGGNGEDGDGAAEASAYLGGGAGGGVAAHAAALCVGGE